MIFLVGLYLFLKGWLYLIAWMVWLCLAMSGAALVALFALCCIPLGIGGRIFRDGMRSLAPPAWMIRKSRT